MHTFFRSIVYILFLMIPVLGVIVALVSAYFEVQVVADLLGKFWIAVVLVLVLELIKVSLVLSFSVIGHTLTTGLRHGFRTLQVVLLTISFIASCALLARAFDRQDIARNETLANIASEYAEDLRLYRADMEAQVAIQDTALAVQRTVFFPDGRHQGVRYKEAEAKRRALRSEEADGIALRRMARDQKIRAARNASYNDDYRAQHPAIAPVVQLIKDVFGVELHFASVSFFLAVLLSFTMELCIVITMAFFGQANKDSLHLLFEQLRLAATMPPDTVRPSREPGRRRQSTRTRQATDRQARRPKDYTLKKIY